MQRLLLLLSACLAVVSADAIEEQHPLESNRYNFVYAVNDPITNDVKNQWERRAGDRVQGSYRLMEADGTTRIVDYYADDREGFKAVVRHERRPTSGRRAASSLPQQSVLPATRRGYFGATFVKENNYGLGMGYL